MDTNCSDIAKHFSGTFQSFQPFKLFKKTEAYKVLPLSIQKQLLSEGETYLNYIFPPLQATDFMRFKKTGERSYFENIYFSKRHALNALVVAECMERKGRFLDSIINGIFSICEESAWQLPAHNSYVRDTPQYILPDSSRPILDLFACETGAMLAMIHFLLKEALDEVSPVITHRIQDVIHSRILTPYIQSHFWWMGNDDEPMCNWTVWCTQNILLTTFLLETDPILLGTVLRKAALSCDYFLKDYGIDGCCDEGAQYYRHAGLCLYNALFVMNDVTDGAFSSLFSHQKICNIASYILNVHVQDIYYINFADCSPIAGRCGAREFLFGKATGNKQLMQFAANDFRSSANQLYSDEVNQLNLFYRLQTLSHYLEIVNYDTHVPVLHPDIYYQSVGLFITRNETFCLSAKAGDNADSHNHNDTGSFTLYKNGDPLFIDIGVESYTQKTFSENRYEIWTMQSSYHNLPSILGIEEHDGKSYRATNVLVEPSKISMNLATAYPLSDISLYYNRTISLNKDKNIIYLVDQTNCSDIVLNFITYEKPFLQNGELLIGKLGKCQFYGAQISTIETLPVTDPRLQIAWKHSLYRIRMHCSTGKFEMNIL